VARAQSSANPARPIQRKSGALNPAQIRRAGIRRKSGALKSRALERR